ncbi:hypothetical protein HK405_002343 [Cladochytrium tenue]|nr:hypothetical protein HK405_002343 [Cladochytrium tenue]
MSRISTSTRPQPSPSDRASSAVCRAAAAGPVAGITATAVVDIFNAAPSARQPGQNDDKPAFTAYRRQNSSAAPCHVTWPVSSSRTA